MVQKVIDWQAEDGSPLKITLSELDLGGNDEFGAHVVNETLNSIENTIKQRPALATLYTDLVAELAISKGRLPSEQSLRFAFSWEGTKLLVEILMRKMHPTPMDDATLTRFVQDKYRDIQAMFRELLPLPKVTGPTSASPK